jgi:GT2 family glycosyltransferase
VPSISVVILNYNGRRWLAGCLDALAGQAGAPVFETIVVDNGSQDGSATFVRTTYPWARLVELPGNRGFAAGNNAGARDARGEWLAFLNNDTVAEKDWLARLRAAATTRPGFALITSRLVFLDDPSRIDSAGDGYLRAGGAFKHGHGARAAAFAASREVFGACGGAFMIRREVFASLGGFDERFFMVYEDVDLSYRARLQGLRVWYAADAIVRHAVGGSSGVLSPATVFYGQRNLEWTWLKNTPWRLLVATAIPHALYSASGVLHYIRAGRGRAALRAKVAALAEIVAVLKARRRVQAAACRPSPPVEALMARHWFAAKRREKRFDGGRVTGPA